VTTSFLVRAALAAAALAGAIAFGLAYRSHVRFNRSFDTLYQTVDWSRTVRELRASDSGLNPTAAREGAIAIALLGSARPQAAERVVADAARREPGNAQAWVALTQVQVSRGRTVAARVSWAHARRLDPHLRAALPAAIRVRPGPA
jgi:predicted Zn-dependent protease